MEYVIKEIMCVEIKRDSVTVGTVRNMHNLLSYGVVRKSVCRMWKAAITVIRCTCSAAATVPASGWTSVQSRPSPSGRPQRQSIMRLCGIRCKDYTCISSPSTVPDFPDTIDVMLSSAKISSSTSDGIGLPCVQPGTFSFTALATLFAKFTFICPKVQEVAERSSFFTVFR